MSPTCSKRFLAGRKALSAAVLTIRSPPSRAQLWAARRHLDPPPAHQHPDQAESRRRVIVLATVLPDVLVRDPPPLVLGGLGHHRLEAGAVLLRGAAPLALRAADVLDAA